MALSPMQILLEQKRDQKSTQALSDGLRRRKDLGQLVSLVGTQNQQRFGGGLLDDVNNQDQRAMTQGQYDSANDYRERAFKETLRRNKAMEKLAGQKAEKTSLGKNPTATTQKRAEDAIGNYTGLKHLNKSFEDDYANNSLIPWEGEMSNATPNVFKTQAMKDQLNWWKEYRRQYELGARNTLFGSALTDSEIAAWNAANLAPNSPPDMIRTALKDMERVQKQVLRRTAQQDASFHNRDWVQATYGDLDIWEEPTALPPSGGGGESSPPPAQGKSVSWRDL